MNLKNRICASCVAISVFLMVPMMALAKEIKLEEGTPVRLKLLDTISSKSNHEGDSISFRVVDDITTADGKTVLIKSGAVAWGSVTEVQERGMVGSKGELSLSIEATKASDGKRVPLRASLHREGKGKLGTVVALSLIITPLFLFMRGKNAKVPAGTIINAYVDRDIMVAVADAPTPAQTAEATGTENSVPVNLLHYTDSEVSESVKSLEQLRDQGVLTQKEFERKKESLLK